MKDTEFWNLLDEARTGPVIDLEALRIILQGLSDSALEGFDEKLQGEVERLGTRAVRNALMGNPVVVDGDGWSDDGFEFLRAGIVALGEEAYRSVLRNPSVLSTGTWEEREELLYLAQDILEERYGEDEGQGQGPLRWQVGVSHERYPVVRSKPLEEGFPVATFSWLAVRVEDTSEMPWAIYEHPDGEVVVYPEHQRLYDPFGNAGHEIQGALRDAIDFRRLPGLVLYVLVTVGESKSPSRWQLMPDFTGELVLGIASGLTHERLANLSPGETESLARSVILDALELYFTGHPTEQRCIFQARQRIE